MRWPEPATLRARTWRSGIASRKPTARRATGFPISLAAPNLPKKRLRDMMKSLSSLPAGCSEVRPPADPVGFAKWQSDVLNFKADTLDESLPGLVFKQKLALPLRPDLNNLKFSPDGKYLLAQDEGGMQVLNREPFAVVFFIDASDAEKAFFSPDSHSVIFYTPALRI